MDVTGRCSDTGRTCAVDVSCDETVASLREKVAQSLGLTHSRKVFLHADGQPLGGDERPVSQCGLEAGSEVELMYDRRPVVCTSGSHTTLAGFAGDVVPVWDTRTVVGKLRTCMKGMALPGMKETYAGGAALRIRGILSLLEPVDCGTINSWDTMGTLWRHTFEELAASTEDHPLLLTNRDTTSSQEMLSVAFEQLGVPSVCCRQPAELCLLASGFTSGLVLDSGHTETYAVAVHEGRILQDTEELLGFGGRDVEEQLYKGVAENSYRMDRREKGEMKEAYSYVPLNPDTEAAAPVTHELPDGCELTIGDERFLCSELLFHPARIGSCSEGVHQAVNLALKRCSSDVRAEVGERVVLAGGTTLLDGFVARLQAELAECVEGAVPELHVSEGRRTSVWLGGSILASTPGFSAMCTTKQEYDECGRASQ